MSLYYWISFTAVLLFVVWSLFYFWRNTDKYVENLQFIRKTFYVFFVLMMGCGILFKQLDLQNWPLILELAALFVFIDLAVFQTPDILKIWNTEFQHSSYIRKTIKKNEEVLGYNAIKVQNFTEVISKSPDHFSGIPTPAGWSQYRNELKKYLELYAETFQFHISIFPFDIDNDSYQLKQNLTGAFSRLEMFHNKAIQDAGWRDRLIEKLLEGRSIELKDKQEEEESSDMKKKAFIVAYYGESYNMLIGISSHFVDVDGIDASHILNMAQIFDWFMVE
ncbi:type II toxin-antitoxin system SpoIISA family toxin [Metabacillus mangrovi]|uniref:type II toxin-antitoxin system SpoIISA family toxin n=1 Tax=Metabacillus mangrovi TaxID=1491830 RepID=UPI0012BAFB44